MFRTLRGIIDSRISGENAIFAIQNLYDATSKINGGDEPHIRLIKTAQSRLRAQNLILRKGYSDVDITVRSFTLSAVPACLPEGHNSRLLALHLLRMERPDVWSRFSEFRGEEARLLRALERDVVQGETLLNIYKRHNPMLQIVDSDDDQEGYNFLCVILAELERNFAPQFEIPAARKGVVKREHLGGDGVQGQLSRQVPAQEKAHDEVDQGSQGPSPNELTMAGWEPDEDANAVDRHDAVHETFVEKSDCSEVLPINPDEHDAAWLSAPTDHRIMAHSQPNKTNKPTLEEIERTAKLAIEYDQAIATAWAELQDLPREFQGRFINDIGTNPGQDIDALVARLKASNRKRLRPYDDDEANDILEQVRSISTDAEAEFRDVYALLGNKVPVAELLSRVEAKFGFSEAKKARLKKERQEKERLERERLEKERLERERVEKNRLELELLEKQWLERRQREQEMQEREEREREQRNKRELARQKRQQLYRSVINRHSPSGLPSVVKMA